MTWTVSVLSRGVEYDLSDGADYLLTGIDGIGHAAVRRLSERGPMQHGETDLGYRLQPRRIALAIEARGGDRAAWLARREELMRILRASDHALSLRLSRGTTWRRQIDCYLSGEMAMAADNLLAPLWQRVAVELVAPDPTWYDPAGVSVPFSLGGGGLLAIPLAVPMQVGASSIDQSIVVQYAGTWDAYPIITAVGPITNLLIQNNTLGDKLDFSGVTIAAGDSYVIDCRYGYKTVTRTSDSATRIQDLTADSNLATFRIGAHPDVPSGTNSIRVAASGLTAASAIYIQYHTRYVGV